MCEPIVKCTEIRDSLRKKKQDEVWSIHLEWIKTLYPFWEKAIERIVELTGFDKVKAEKHLRVAENAFSFMDDWYFKRIKYVKARRNEIDSAISFIRNHALDNSVAKYWFAPICRNASGFLRSGLWLSTYDNPNDYVITSIAQQVYVMAEIRVCLHYDSDDFVFCLPRGESIHTDNPADFDNLHIMYSHAAKSFDLEEEIETMNKYAAKLWANWETPEEWKIPEDIWTKEIGNLSKQLYYSNMSAFYGK